MSIFKVYGGEITEAMDMLNPNTSSKERLSQLLAIAGKNREKAEKIVAGDIPCYKIAENDKAFRVARSREIDVLLKHLAASPVEVHHGAHVHRVHFLDQVVHALRREVAAGMAMDVDKRELGLRTWVGRHHEG